MSDEQLAGAALPIISLEDALEPFLSSHPWSYLREAEDGIVVMKPWSDDTLELRIPSADAIELINLLNVLYLSPRFTAIWHRDSGDLEFIFTAFPLELEMSERSFDFRFDKATYTCEFGDASQRLLDVAANAVPIKPPSLTQHRNLEQFRTRHHYIREHGEEELGAAISFWIRDIDWDENAAVELARHVNFFMTYFDRHTATILIHEPPASVDEDATLALRYLHGPFPKTIAARQLDEYLLTLWDGMASTANPFLEFMYAYQVFEYAAFYHLRDDALLAIKKVLAAPDAPSRLEETTQLVLETIAEDRRTDDAKIQTVIQQYVSPAPLWRQIDNHKSFFSTPTMFDGGFQVEPLVRAEWKSADFEAAWIPKFPDTVRRIRNALVHAREARNARGIAPTRLNSTRLSPWSDLVRTTAMELIAYRSP